MTPRLEGKTVLVVGAGTQRSDDPEAPVGNGRAIAVWRRAKVHTSCARTATARRRRRRPGG